MQWRNLYPKKHKLNQEIKSNKKSYHTTATQADRVKFRNAMEKFVPQETQIKSRNKIK
jgi:hypothetical protein